MEDKGLLIIELNAPGPVSWKSRYLFGTEKQVAKLQSTCFGKWFFNMALM